MTAWFHQTRLELLLMIRMRWPFLLPLAAGIFLWVQMAGMASNYAEIRTVLIDVMRTFHTLSLALPILLGVLLVRRDLLHPAFGWMHALPVSNAGYLLGKLSAGFLYLMLIPLATCIAYTITYRQAGLPLADWAGSVMPILAQQSGSYAVTLILGMAIGVLVPGRFALPIAFCGWLFGSVFLQEFIVVRLGWYMLKPFFLHHFLNAEFMMNEGWSQAFAEEYTDFVPFVVLFMAFLLAWSAAAIGRTRPEGAPLVMIGLTIVALALSAAAYVPYAAKWSDRYAHVRELTSAAPPLEAIRPHDPYVFEVESAAADVTKISEHGIRVHATLKLPMRDNALIAAGNPERAPLAHEPGSATFLLHPSLRIFEVKVNGSASEFKRRGDRLSVPLPKPLDKTPMPSAVIELHYEGELDEWVYYGNGEYYMAFVRDQGLYLPGYIGWFPIPGGDTLFYRLDPFLYNREDTGIGTGWTHYELELHGFGRLPVYGSLPSSESGSDTIRFVGTDTAVPTLFGGRYIRIGEPADGPAVITTPTNRANGERYLEELKRRIAYYAQWLGPEAADSAARLRQIVYYPINAASRYRYLQPDSLTSGTVFLSSYDRSPLGSSELQSPIRLMLFGDNHDTLYSDRVGNRHSIVGEIRNAFLLMYELERGTDPQWMYTPYVALTPGGLPVMDNIAYMLQEAVANGRSAQARGTLEHFYRKGLSIESSQGLPNDGSEEERYPIVTYEEWLDVWQHYADHGEKEADSID